jgi:hypothetical protein
LPLAKAQLDAVGRAGDVLKNVGAGTGKSQYQTAGDRIRAKNAGGYRPNSKSDFTAWFLGRRGLLQTLPDYGQGGSRTYDGKNDRNEVMVNQLDFDNDTGVYTPGGVETPPPMDPLASDIALAAALLHEYDHCLQDGPEFATGAAKCKKLEEHIEMYSKQTTFIMDAIGHYGSQLSITGETQLLAYLRWLNEERERIEKELQTRRDNNECL